MSKDKTTPERPARIDLPNGWYFVHTPEGQIVEGGYWHLRQPNGDSAYGQGMPTRIVQAFAAAMAPQDGLRAALDLALKHMGVLRDLIPAQREEYFKKAKAEVLALSATPATQQTAQREVRPDEITPRELEVIKAAKHGQINNKITCGLEILGDALNKEYADLMPKGFSIYKIDEFNATYHTAPHLRFEQGKYIAILCSDNVSLSARGETVNDAIKACILKIERNSQNGRNG